MLGLMICVETEAIQPATRDRLHTELGMVLGAADKEMKAMVFALQEVTEEIDWKSVL